MTQANSPRQAGGCLKLVIGVIVLIIIGVVALLVAQAHNKSTVVDACHRQLQDDVGTSLIFDSETSPATAAGTGGLQITGTATAVNGSGRYDYVCSAESSGVVLQHLIHPYLPRPSSP